jgi:hypothetical protein
MSKYAKTISARFIERADALQLRGKRRDDAALDYFVGAAAGAELAGNINLGKHLGTVALLIVSIRGYKAVEEMAKEAE